MNPRVRIARLVLPSAAVLWSACSNDRAEPAPVPAAPSADAMASMPPTGTVAAPAPVLSSDPIGIAPEAPTTTQPLGSASTPEPAVTPMPSEAAAGAGPESPEFPSSASGGAPTAVESDAGRPASADADAGQPRTAADAGEQDAPGIRDLPDPGPEGDGEHQVGPNFTSQPELAAQGAPRGQTFRFTLPLSDSAIFDGRDATLEANKPVNETRGISVYVPAQYEDGTAAPVLVIQDGDGPLTEVSNALDNLTIADDPARRLPAFVAVAVQNGGSDGPGSERGLEYDTLSDRYARFIDEEVLPAVEANPELRASYPNFRFTDDPSGRGALGCSSGGAAAFTMAWFRPDLFSRVLGYSPTLVNQQDPSAPEAATYPHGAWDYHSELALIANSDRKPIRVFLSATENDLGARDPESTMRNWVMANERSAAALAAKGYHYRYVFGLGAGHCDFGFQQATLADALIWVWRGYQPSTE